MKRFHILSEASAIACDINLLDQHRLVKYRQELVREALPPASSITTRFKEIMLRSQAFGLGDSLPNIKAALQTELTKITQKIPSAAWARSIDILIDGDQSFPMFLSTVSGYDPEFF